MRGSMKLILTLALVALCAASTFAATKYVVVAMGCRSPVFHISTYLRGMASIGWLSGEWFSGTSPFDWGGGTAPPA